MYLEFGYVLLDYFSVLNKSERWFDILVPAFIGIGSACYEKFDASCQFAFITSFIPFAEILMGFMLTALVFLCSSEKLKSSLNEYPSGKKIRGIPVSLYRVILVNMSFIILLSVGLIIAYFIAKAIPLILSPTIALIPNTVFIVLSFSLMMGTIRAITNIYLIQTK